MEHLFKNPILQAQLEALLKTTPIDWSTGKNGAICVRGVYEEAFASLVDAVRALVFPSPTVLFLDSDQLAKCIAILQERGLEFEEELALGRHAIVVGEDLKLEFDSVSHSAEK